MRARAALQFEISVFEGLAGRVYRPTHYAPDLSATGHAAIHEGAVDTAPCFVSH